MVGLCKELHIILLALTQSRDMNTTNGATVKEMGKLI